MRNRSRYSEGAIPTSRCKVLRSVSAVPKPWPSRDGLEWVVAFCEGTLRRLDADPFDVHGWGQTGLRVNRRCRCRGLSPASDAKSSIPCRAPGSRWMASTTSRITSLAGCADHNGTLNCDWFPGRRRNSTSSRATPRAVWGPRSASTSASAKSMPAATPAEVQIGPSWMKMVAVDDDCGILPRQPVRFPPVSGHATPVEQPGLGEDERAATDRRDPVGLGGGCGHPVDQAAVGPRRIHALTTHDQQRPGTARIQARHRALRVDRQPRVRADRTRLRGHDRELVSGLTEHLERAGHIESVEAIEDHEGDCTRLHGSTVPPGWHVVYDNLPTDCAIRRSAGEERRESIVIDDADVGAALTLPNDEPQ